MGVLSDHDEHRDVRCRGKVVVELQLACHCAWLMASCQYREGPDRLYILLTDIKMLEHDDMLTSASRSR